MDPNIAYNNLPKLPPEIDLKDQDLLLATLEASDAIAQLKTLLTMSDRNLINTLDLLSPLFVPEAVSSSGVENIITTNESVYVAKISEERELTPAEKEAINYTKALMHGALQIGKNGFLATNDYIDIQKILEPSKPGIRTMPGTHLSNPITHVTYYTPPEGEGLIRDLLKDLEIYFNDPTPTHEIFARMAVLHYQFEAIHPFHDGNGRTGRMLMPLYLTMQKRLPAPILFISHYILEHRDEYYEKLRGVTNEGKWKEWILYIIKATTDQAMYTSEILTRIQETIKIVRKTIKERLTYLYTSELVDFLFSNVIFTGKKFETELGISRKTARKYLEALEVENVIQKQKQTGKNRYLYITPTYINILRNA